MVLLGSHFRGRPGFLFLMHVPLVVSLLSVSDSEDSERAIINKWLTQYYVCASVNFESLRHQRPSLLEMHIMTYF